MERCVCISCFDYYTTRMQQINGFFIKNNYELKYLYASFDHFSKKENINEYRNGVKIKVPKYSRNLSIQRLYSHYKFASVVMRYINKYNPDVIYCMIPPNILVKKLAKYKDKNQRVKLIFDCYDFWPESFPYSKFMTLLKLPFLVWRNLRRRYISEADLIITVSEQCVQVLTQEVGNKPIRVIRPVINMDILPNYSFNVDELSFCYLGMINHITDIDLGVELLGSIARFKPVTLHIIGEGQNLNEFVKRLELASVNVICHGVIFDMDEKNKIFSICNMGLNIPREEIGSTMSLKAIEYLRAGLPFLNSAGGDIRNIVKEDMVGINIEEDLDIAADEILKLTKNKMQIMHERCVLSYRNRFIEQDYKTIFRHIV